MSYLSTKTRNLDPVINYISNGRAYNSTQGWVLYADAAGAQPVDGTGGVANITWSRDTTTPLRQGADFNLVKDAVNRQGQGVSFDFTIDLADQGKVLTVSFDYEIVSGTYATGDLAVYLVQDTAGTPVVVQPAGFQIQSATVGTKMSQIATFQTASNITTYRLCVHVASTSASAYTLAIDNVVVGPQTVQYGSPITDWQSYTPTFTGFGTATAIDGRWRRVGDSVELNIKWTNGTRTATEARVSLPAGLTSVAFAQSGARAAGVFVQVGGAAQANYVLIEPSVTYVTFGLQSSTQQSITKQNGNALGSDSQAMALNALIPIAGWSSTVQMSNSTDTRIIATTVNRITTAQSPATTGWVKILFNNTLSDKSGSWDSANTRYVCPVPGTYSGSGFIHLSNSSALNIAVALYKNGVVLRQIGSVIGSATARTSMPFSFLADFNAGDILELYINCGGATLTIEQDGVITGGSQWNISRLSGPSAIAATETVNARYQCIASNSVSAALPVQFNFKDYDSHNAVTTGSGWKFTAPIAGKYLINTLVYITANNATLDLYKNGSYYCTITGNISNTAGGGSTTLSLLAGDYIDIRTGSAQTTGNSGGAVYIDINRVGN